MKNKRKTCPFCGFRASDVVSDGEDFWIRRRVCKAEGPKPLLATGHAALNPDEAIEMWNTRRTEQMKAGRAMSKHTPGPWEKAPWSDEFQSVRIFSKAGIVGFSANSDMTREELEANAIIMTFSPEMLEALSDMVSSIRAIDANDPGLNLKELLKPEIEFCEAVIKKAGGLA